MAKGNTKHTNGSALEFEAQFWAAAEQAVPAPNGKPMDDHGVRPEGQDVRWKFGIPPVNNANYGWVQHFIHQKSRTLAALLEALLPKLLSGELRVPAAAQLVEATA